MAVVPDRYREFPSALPATTPTVKSPAEEQLCHTFGSFLYNWKYEDSNLRAETRNLRCSTSPRSVPSLCDDSTPSTATSPYTIDSEPCSPVSPTFSRAPFLADKGTFFSGSQPIWGRARPVKDEPKSPSGNQSSSFWRIRSREERYSLSPRCRISLDDSQHYDQMDFVKRWLHDAAYEATTEYAHAQKDGAQHRLEYKGKSAVQPTKRRLSSDHTTRRIRSEITCADESTDLATTEAMIEFHHNAVRDLLQEFQQLQLHRNNNSGDDSKSSGPTANTSTTVNSSSEVPLAGTLRAGHGASSRGHKRRSDEDDEDRPLPQRNKSDPVDEVGLPRSLACPFAKRGPLRYRKCFGYTDMRNSSRVKLHLQREHYAPVHCSRCWETFNSQPDLFEHLRQDPACQTLPPQTLDGINEVQQNQLKKRLSAKYSEVEKWNIIYAILFPGSPLPESPFLDLHSMDETYIMREWFRQQVPDYIERQELPSLLRGNEQQLKTLVSGIIDALVDGYAENCERASSISASHTPRSQGRQTMLLSTPSDETNFTPATTFSSNSAGTSNQCPSPCPQPRDRPPPSSGPLHNVLGVGGLGEGSDQQCAGSSSDAVPVSMQMVPSVMINGPDNSLGIFVQELDGSAETLDERMLFAFQSDVVTSEPAGDDFLSSMASHPWFS